MVEVKNAKRKLYEFTKREKRKLIKFFRGYNEKSVVLVVFSTMVLQKGVVVNTIKNISIQMLKMQYNDGKNSGKRFKCKIPQPFKVLEKVEAIEILRIDIDENFEDTPRYMVHLIIGEDLNAQMKKSYRIKKMI